MHHRVVGSTRVYLASCHNHLIWGHMSIEADYFEAGINLYPKNMMDPQM